MHKILTSNIVNELVILNSNNKLKDSNNNLNTKLALCNLNSKQLSNSACNLETPLILFSCRVNKFDNDYNINNNKLTPTAKRQRSVSPCSSTRYASMLLLLHSRDVKNN